MSYSEMIFDHIVNIVEVCLLNVALVLEQVYIGYLPNQKVIGLSKLARSVYGQLQLVHTDTVQ